MDSKKQFEHIEDKIRQAAANYQPPFDEKAWQDMAAKLDSDKKKRRPFLWWLAVPLLLGGLYGAYKMNDKSGVAEKNITANATLVDREKGEGHKKTGSGGNLVSANGNNEVEAVEKKVGDNLKDKGTGIKSSSTLDKLEEKNADPKTKPADNVAANNNTIKAQTQKGNPYKVVVRKKGNVKATNSGGETGTIANGELGSDKKQMKNEEAGNDAASAVEPTAKQKEGITAEEKADVLKEADKKKEPAITKTEPEQEVKTVAEKKEKDKIKKHKGFYFQATGGIDAGSLKMCSFKSSSFTPKYGTAVGYQFSKRLSMQTGFYAASKKYTAAPKDYTIKPGSPMGAYPLDKIKATCLVYEIPLAIKYDIISKPSFILFGTAGLSSYIMQKEQYDCSYTYYNNTYETEWLFKGNKHLFSTAVLSIGIEKKLWDQVSLLAEPSLSVPLKGVGDGSMKIYSSSLQLGLKYYLFKRQ